MLPLRNDETENQNDKGRTNDEQATAGLSSFMIRYSFGLLTSDFVI
jgi:hypothetical protein